MNIIELLKLEEKISIDELEKKLDIFRNYQHYIYIGIIILFSLQLIINNSIPTFQSYKKESKTLKQHKKILDLRTKQAANKENVQNELQRLNQILIDKKKIFFKSNEVEEFSISTLSKTAEKFDINIAKINFKKKIIDKTKIIKYPITINFKGTFDQIMQFIFHLEGNEKIIKITDFTFNRTSLDPIELSVNLSIQLYILKSSNQKK